MPLAGQYSNQMQFPMSYGTPFYVLAKGTSVNNNGGAVLGVSKASLQNTRLFDTDLGWPYLGQRDLYNDNKPNGNSASPFNNVMKATSGGKFAIMTQGKYIMLGFTSIIAGVANTTLNSPGLAYFGHSQNIVFSQYVNSLRKSQTGGWQYMTGLPINAQNSRDKVSSEVQNTYASPGRITYLQGALTALTKSYQAKTD